MSLFQSRPALRWLVPTSAAVVVLGGGAAIGTLAAASEPNLPPRDAAQLLVDLQTARLDGLSGTVLQRADLGLPPALETLAGNSSELAALATGRHTLRVWYAGPDQARIALVGTLGETDVIRNGSDAWVWSSQKKEAVHYKLDPGKKEESPELPGGLPATPEEAADKALAAIDPTTEVRVGRSATIAGRDAYELILAPRDKASLVEEIRIAIDAEEKVPLRFEVFAEGVEEPAFEVAFTQVDFNRPAPEQFVFNPPPGTKVTESDAKGAGPDGAPFGGHRPDGESAEPGTAPEQRPETRTVGTGWTTVLVGTMPESAPGAPGTPGAGGEPGADLAQLAGMLDQFPAVSGDWGSGRLFSTHLFNVLLTDDGRVIGGLVTPERLYEVAAQTK
ncbi:hypothetical protein AB0M79_16665 [Polymorphospora sp. NPDC051019]|uniref:LolA family protein n=1 Tax=Polymorphospora sp. NPDC051019 TaxID=3155725 RepID=UPI00341854A0